MKLGHIGALILICGIGMSCLAIPIPDTIDIDGDGDGGERYITDEIPGGRRALLRASRPTVARAPVIRAPVIRAPVVRAPVVRAPVVRAPVVRARVVVHPPVVRARVVRARVVVHPPVVRPPVVRARVVVSRPVRLPAVRISARIRNPIRHPAKHTRNTRTSSRNRLPVVRATVSAPVPMSAANKWLATVEGGRASRFCNSLGIKNKPQIYAGCLEDMMVMKNEEIARLGALTAEEFLAKESANTNNRYCIASGDPHFTSYDRDIYHLQEEGIFEIAGSDDDKFEVQERVKKNGANKPGVPSCMIGAVVRFGDVYIEVDVYNYGKLRVNGVSVDLAKDTTKTYGGVQVRYGKQNIAWRGQKDQTTAMKIAGPGGFSVMIEGGYCGTLEVNVPTAYFGKMKGLCGNADGTATTSDFSSPDGKVMDVKRGGKDWQMSGYGGPNSPLSKWQLAWKPVGAECLFAAGCETLSTATVSTPMHARRAAEKRVVVKVVVAPSAPAPASAPTKRRIIVDEIVATATKTNPKLTEFQKKLVSIIKSTSDEQAKIETENLNNYNGVNATLHAEILHLESARYTMAKLSVEIQRLNATIQSHYKKLVADTKYIQTLDAIRPTFFKSLGELESHIGAVKTVVDQNLIKDEYKDEMIGLLSDIHFNMHNISGYVATAFVNHYNKYKALIKTENIDYSLDMKRLAALSTEYKIQFQKNADIEKERARLQDILAKLKMTLSLSVSQREDFDILVKQVISIFEKKHRC